MVLVVKDRVKDTSTTSGTGTITLDNSPPAGYQAFSTLGNGSTTYYAIQDANDAFEIGLGTYNANTLTRTTVLSSSNSGNLVNLTSGPNTVWVDYPASKAYLSEEGIDKSFTATANITAGKPVVLNSAGTVTQVAETSTSFAVGTSQEIATTSSNDDYQVVYDTYRNKALAIYRNGASPYNVLYKVGTIDTSANSITWGTAGNVNTTGTHNVRAVYDEVQQATIVFYNDNNTNPQTGKCLAITLDASGNATVGSTGTFSSNPVDSVSATYCQGVGTVVAYDVSSGNFESRVVTVSGTTVTLGTAYTVTTNEISKSSVAYDTTNNKVVVVYSDATNSYYSTYAVGSISGTTVTYETPVVFISNATPRLFNTYALVFDKENSKFIYNGYTSNTGQVYVGSLSGTTVTWGSAQQYSTTTHSQTISYNPTTKNTLLAYRNTSTNYPVARTITLNGSTATFGNETNLSTINVTGNIVQTNSANTKSIASYVDNSNNNYDGNVVTMPSSSTNLTTSNYLGVASTSAGANETVNINIPGSINNDQVGLTIGEDYYATEQGTILPRSTTTTTTDTNISSSSNYEFDYASYNYDVSVAYDTVNNKIGVAGRNYNNYLSLTIGSQSGTAITWGTPVIVKSSNVGSANTSYRLAYGNGVFVATYVTGAQARLKAGEVSGTNSITLGSELVPNGSDAAGTRTSVSYNSNAGKFIFSYSLNSTTSIGCWIVSNSGTTLSVGQSAADLTITNAGNNYGIFANIYDPDTYKTIIGVDGYSDDTGRIYALTISGSSLTAGTPYSMTGPYYEEGSSNLIYDTNNNKFLLLQAPNVAGTYTIQGTVLTASGTTFTGGTKTQLSTDKARYITSFFDTVNNKIMVAYQLYQSPYNGALAEVTISGTTPSWTALTTTILNQTTERVFPKSALFNPDTNTGLVVGTFDMSADDGMAAVLYYDTTTSSVINGSQFVGKAISSTQLLLGEEKGNSMAGLSNGAITKGKPVVMQADGDVAETGFNTTSVTNTGSASQGSLGNIDPYTQDMFCMAVASDGVTYCFTYQNSTNNYQACKIGTRSGETITWGSEITLSTNTSSDSHFCSYDANANVFVTSYATGNTIKSTAVSFSGNTGTKGTEVTMMDLGSSSGSPQYHYQHWYDSTNKVTVCWANGGVSGNDTNRSSAVTLSLSGTIITLGTLYENTSAGGDYQKGCDITGGKHVCYWKNSSGYPSVMTMTVASDYSITWGTPLVINTANGGFCNPIYNPNYENKAILAGKIATTYNKFSYAGLTISGTSITASNFSDGNINNASSYVESGGNVGVYSNYSGNYCFVYQTYSPYNSRYNFATTTDGLSLTVATAVTTTGHGSNQFYAGACASDVDAVVVENHRDGSNTQMVYYCFNPTFNFVQSITSTNLTTTNYLGIASNTVADNEECIIDTQGAVNSNQSSLTPGQLYYVQTDGTLSTTAGSPSVIAGIATSATTLLITKS